MVYRNIIYYFFILTIYPVSLLNSFTNPFLSLWKKAFGFYKYTVISLANNVIFLSLFSSFKSLYLLFLLLAYYSDQLLNRRVLMDIFVSFPVSWGKSYYVSLLHILLAVGFIQIHINRLRKFNLFLKVYGLIFKHLYTFYLSF